MKLSDCRVIRLHLRVNHGINVKHYQKKKKALFVGGSRIFGVSLENLPRHYIPEYGRVPCFVMDACSFLLERAGTVGLFRKAGSVLRIKTLRTKLNRGEGWLSTALPYDVASLLKQFCREQPEPLFPTELHAALLRAQALPTLKERTVALQLLSCLLPASNASLLHYLFVFLSNVSQRCAENLMTSSNLAVVFAPCLLPPSNEEKLTDPGFQLRVDVLRAFIEDTHSFGVVPKAVKDSTPFILASCLARDKMHSLGRSVSCLAKYKMHYLGRSREKSKLEAASWTPVRSDVGQGDPSTDRRPLRRSLGLETFPNILIFRTYCCPPPTDPHLRRPTTALLDTSVGKLKPKGIELGVASCVSKPELTKMRKLNLSSWRRCSY